MSAPINAIGQKYNKLTAIEPLKNKTGQSRIWLFQCDCGNICEKQLAAVRFGSVKSCGCLRKGNSNKPQTAKALARPKGEAGLDLLHSDMKYSSKKRGIEYLLNIEQLKEITSKNCFYCDVKPDKIKQVNRSKGGLKTTQEHGQYIYNPIDRIDSSKGYIYENCVPCCSKCNFMKHTLSLEDFKNQIIKIYKNLELNK